MQTNPIPENLKSDHLILPVGGNPLPNAVAGKLLLAEGGILTLLQSAGTHVVAQRLKDWLKKSLPAQTEYWKGSEEWIRFKEVRESDPVDIWQGVRAELDAVGKKRVGLTYTGGTKAMAVHAYRGVESWANERRARANCSYLDARGLQLVFDPPDFRSAENVHRVKVALSMRLGLEKDLMALHSWKLDERRPGQKHALLPTAALRIAECASSLEIGKVWDEWRKSARRTLEQEKKPMPLPEASELQPVAKALRAELRLAPGHSIPPNAFSNPPTVAAWLDSMWLESAVMQAALDCQEDCHLHEVIMNPCPKNHQGRPIHCEIDVIALRGYQLYGFSCCIDDEITKLKLKLFEALVRARQLGGDEARVGLVCCHKDPRRVEEEVRSDWELEGRIRVFGRPDLADLRAAITDWINTQSEED